MSILVTVIKLLVLTVDVGRSDKILVFNVHVVVLSSPKSKINMSSLY
jgi:hypothetical protein